MRAGLLFDVDHMSQRAINGFVDANGAAAQGALDIAEQFAYPVLSAHASFRDLSPRRPRDPNHLTNGERKSVHLWPHESEKTRAQAERISRLGGVIAPIISVGDKVLQGRLLGPGCSGSSTTWAEEYLYALDRTGGHGVAIGTDANSLLRQATPRFGTLAAWGLKDEAGATAERRRQANYQQNGVRYREPLRDYRAYRFPATDICDAEERDIWEAIALFRCGVDPHHQTPDGPGFFNRTQDVQYKINNIAKGFFAAREEDLELRDVIFSGDTYAEQRAAFLVHKNLSPTTDRARDPARVLELYPKIKGVWERWIAMDGRNVALARSFAGRRDFDINIDGVAHYGMLPDFLQDLKNIGLSDNDLAPLFRSAEDYIRTWERCEAQSLVVQAAQP
jgi:hypothetical protein